MKVQNLGRKWALCLSVVLVHKTQQYLWNSASSDTPKAPRSTKKGPKSCFRRASSRGGKRRFGGSCQTNTSLRSSSSQLSMLIISSEFIPFVSAASRLRTLDTSILPWYFSRSSYRESIIPITSALRMISVVSLELKQCKISFPAVSYSSPVVCQSAITSEFTQPDGRKRRTAKRSCVRKRDRANSYVFCRDLHLTLMFSGLLQKDLFKEKWSLAKSCFKRKYCHSCHTRFAVFFLLPSCCVRENRGLWTVYTVQYCFLFRFVCIKLVSLIWFLQIWVAIYVYGTLINWSTLIKKINANVYCHSLWECFKRFYCSFE